MWFKLSLPRRAGLAQTVTVKYPKSSNNSFIANVSIKFYLYAFILILAKPGRNVPCNVWSSVVIITWKLFGRYKSLRKEEPTSQSAFQNHWKKQKKEPLLSIVVKAIERNGPLRARETKKRKKAHMKQQLQDNHCCINCKCRAEGKGPRLAIVSEKGLQRFAEKVCVTVVDHSWTGLPESRFH